MKLPFRYATAASALIGLGLTSLLFCPGAKSETKGATPAEVKASIQSSCSGGANGSFVQNNDGTYQCNLSGGTLKCVESTGVCQFFNTYIHKDRKWGNKLGL